MSNPWREALAVAGGAAALTFGPMMPVAIVATLPWLAIVEGDVRVPSLFFVIGWGTVVMAFATAIARGRLGGGRLGLLRTLHEGVAAIPGTFLAVLIMGALFAAVLLGPMAIPGEGWPHRQLSALGLPPPVLGIVTTGLEAAPAWVVLMVFWPILPTLVAAVRGEGGTVWRTWQIGRGYRIQAAVLALSVLLALAASVPVSALIVPRGAPPAAHTAAKFCAMSLVLVYAAAAAVLSWDRQRGRPGTVRPPAP